MTLILCQSSQEQWTNQLILTLTLGLVLYCKFGPDVCAWSLCIMFARSFCRVETLYIT